MLKRTQFSLMLAWTYTYHKVQASSLRKIIVGFHLLKLRNFNFGRIYVALSRVTILEGLHIIVVSVSVKAIRPYHRVLEEYNRMQSESILSVSKIEQLKSHCL